VYWLWVYQRVFHGKADAKNLAVADANSKERWVLVPVVALILVLGVFPRPVIDKITPSITNLIVHTTNGGASK
jgi:NADH-quinone oxidoreductase subunit M